MKRFKARVKRIDIVECICSGETEESVSNTTHLDGRRPPTNGKKEG